MNEKQIRADEKENKPWGKLLDSEDSKNPESPVDISHIFPSTKYPTVHIFSPDEEKLPEVFPQTITVIDPKSEDAKKEIYQSAEAAYHVMLQLFNNDGKFQKELNMKHFHSYSEANQANLLDKSGVLLITKEIKDDGNDKNKTNRDYFGNWTLLNDIVKVAICLDKYKFVKEVFSKIKTLGLDLVKKPVDRFSKPTPVGYRDVIFNVKYPNGHIGEIHIDLKAMIKAKNEVYKLYSELKGFQQAKDENRKEFLPEEETSYNNVFQKSLDLYNNAWDSANEGNDGKTASRKRLTASKNIRARLTTRGGNVLANESQVRYYLLDNMPIYRKPNEFPVQLIGDNKERVVYDLFYFDHNCSMITEGEYTKRKGGLNYE